LRIELPLVARTILARISTAAVVDCCKRKFSPHRRVARLVRSHNCRHRKSALRNQLTGLVPPGS
jgi:hypothetical protein